MKINIAFSSGCDSCGVRSSSLERAKIVRNFVQYHNPDRMGEYQAQEGKYGIVTNKPVKNTVGDRVWLVSRRDNPRDYVLCGTFKVEGVGTRGKGPFRNFAEADRGWAPKHPVKIGHESWFERLRYLTGNFGLGLQAVNDPEVIKGLRRVAKL